MTALVSCWARIVNQSKWPTLLHNRADVTSRYAKVCVTKIKCYMYKFKNWTFVIATLLTLLFASIDTLLTRRTLAWSHHVNKRDWLDIYNWFNPVILHWTVCTKPGMWAVMYMCKAYRSYLCIYDVYIGFWKCSNSVVFLYITQSL